MAPKKTAVAHDAAGAEEIYAVAKADAEKRMAEIQEQIGAIQVESQAMGAIQAIDTTIAFQEMLKAITLQRIKQAKEYKAGGMTWDGFCEGLGMERRTVDRTLDDLRPLIETFSDKMSGFCGMPFSKIRLLGRQLSDNLSEIKDGCLVYGDETIPLTPDHVDDIQALIERIGEESRERAEEAEAQLTAKDKVLKSKQLLLNKQEKDLQRFERQAKAKGLTPEEDAMLGKIDELGIQLNGHCLCIENVIITLHEDPFPNAVAGVVSLLDNVIMRMNAFRENVVSSIAPAGMFPDEEWQPPVGRSADQG